MSLETPAPLAPITGEALPTGVEVILYLDGIEAGRLGASDQVIGVEDAVVGTGPCVAMKVDQHDAMPVTIGTPGVTRQREAAGSR